MGSNPPEKPARPAALPFKVSFRSPKELPILYAQQFTVNFTGNEFYVTVYRAAPDPWNAGETPSAEIDAVPLARFALSPLTWLALVESFSDQIRKLQAEGHISAEQVAAAKKAIGAAQEG